MSTEFTIVAHFDIEDEECNAEPIMFSIEVDGERIYEVSYLLPAEGDIACEHFIKGMCYIEGIDFDELEIYCEDRADINL